MVHGCWVDSHSTVLVGVDLGEHACTHMCRCCGLMAVINALRTKALLLLAPWSINVGCAASSVWNVTLFFLCSSSHMLCPRQHIMTASTQLL